MIIKDTARPPKASRRGGPLTWLALGVALVAVVLLVVQRSEIGELRAALDDLAATARPLVATADTPPTTASARAASPAAAKGEPAKLAALQERLSALEGRVATLQQRRQTQSARVAAAPAKPADVVVDEVSALREDVDALLTGEGIDSEEGREAVRKLVDEMNQERRERWRAVRDKAAEEWLQQVSDDLNLDTKTSERLAEIMQRRRSQRRALFRKVRDEEMTYRDARAEMEAVRDQAKGQLIELLGEESFQVFEQKFDERMQGRGGRGL